MGKKRDDELRLRSNEEVMEASERARLAEHEAGLANERAARAHERAAKAELALAEYQAPRELTGDQCTDLAEQLGKFAGQTYHIHSYAHQECEFLAFQIDEALRWADWERISGGTNMHSKQGIRLEWHRQCAEPTSRAGLLLYEMLRRAGLSATWSWLSKDSVCDNRISITVGTKH